MNDYQQHIHQQPPGGPGDYERIDPDFGMQTFPLYLRQMNGPYPDGVLRQVRLVFGDDVGDWALTSDLLSAREAEHLARLLRYAHFRVRYNDGSGETPFETQLAEGVGLEQEEEKKGKQDDATHG